MRDALIFRCLLQSGLLFAVACRPLMVSSRRKMSRLMMVLKLSLILPLKLLQILFSCGFGSTQYRCYTYLLRFELVGLYSLCNYCNEIVGAATCSNANESFFKTHAHGTVFGGDKRKDTRWGMTDVASLVMITNMAEKVRAYWFLDLSTPDPSHILPILMALTIWLIVECTVQEGIMKIIYKGLAVASVSFTMFFPKAILCYWITNNLFSLGYGHALKVPAAKRFLGLAEIPVTPPAPANGGSQPSSGLSSMLKRIPEASQNPSRSSSAVKKMIQRIENLEKPMKGRKRSKKR